MLIKYGGGVLDARGSIGGQTHSRNRYGSYARARTTPVNPQSERQSLVRNLCANLAEAWSAALNPTERAEWETYADSITVNNKLGEGVKLTGFNHFVRSNAARMRASLTLVKAGPATLALPGTDPTFAVVASEATQTLSVTFDKTLDWAKEVGGALLVNMSAPVGAGRQFIGGPYRYAGKILGAATPPTSPVSVPCPFPVHAGQRIAARARIVRLDGRSSDFFQYQVSVTG